MFMRISHCNSAASVTCRKPTLLDKYHSRHSRTSPSNRRAPGQGWQWEAADKVSWQVLDWDKALNSLHNPESKIQLWKRNWVSSYTVMLSVTKKGGEHGELRTKMSWDKQDNAQLLGQVTSGFPFNVSFLLNFFTMSVSEEKKCYFFKKEYYGYSLGNCQQVKLNRMT